ncbi:MAG: hypothetical protein ACOYJZ_01625 [Acutalibacter sp.]
MKNLIIGVDLGGTNIKASAFDSRSLECLWEHRMATQWREAVKAGGFNLPLMFPCYTCSIG